MKNAILNFCVDYRPKNVGNNENKNMSVEIHLKSALYLSPISLTCPVFWKKWGYILQGCKKN